jgi:hypothetical protein
MLACGCASLRLPGAPLHRIRPVQNMRRLTVQQFRSGELYRVRLPELHWDGASSVQTMIHQVLAKHADRLKVNASKTAAKKFITHDDG